MPWRLGMMHTVRSGRSQSMVTSPTMHCAPATLRPLGLQCKRLFTSSAPEEQGALLKHNCLHQ